MNQALKSITLSSIKHLISYAKSYKISILIITVVSVISSLLYVQIALFSKSMIDAATSTNLANVTKYGIYTAIIFLLQLLLNLFVTIKRNATQQDMTNNIQLQLIQSMYRKEWLGLSAFPTGDLSTRITSDTTNIVNIWINTFPNIIALSFNLIVAFIALARYDIKLASLSFILGPISVLFSWLIGRKLKELTHRVQMSESHFRSYVNESIVNMIILKSFNYIQHNLIKLDSILKTRKDYQLKKVRTQAYANTITALGYRMGFFAALAFGAYRLLLEAITFGTFTAFLQLTSQIQGPMEGLIKSIPGIISTLASIDRLDEIKTINDEESLNLITLATDQFSKLELRDLNFSYVKDTPILKDLNFTISKGEKVAILGNSGQGKTTIFCLILSLIYPDSGTAKVILNEGSELSLDHSTRSIFSYVPQKNILFSGSILDNLVMSKEYTSEDAIKLALTASCCDEFIDVLKDGIHTVIGERVVGLSEGQIQRICIARALLHDSPILILDEATSALDMDTEIELVHNLTKMYKDKTLIAITHRKPILDICDTIYKLSEGQLHLVEAI